MKTLAELHHSMAECFDLTELRTLSFELGIDWDELSGDRKSAKIVSLITVTSQQNRQHELLALLNAKRPNVTWPNVINTLPTSPRDKNLRIRQMLIKKVRDFWIKGVYEKSLYQGLHIELGLEAYHQAVEQPWMVLHEKDKEPELVSPSTEITHIFNQLHGTMLILGEPGAGKTTMLLELTRDLLDLAEIDGSQPIPIVLNLSSWAVKQLPILEWLIEELNIVYQVNKNYAREWLKLEEVRLMLDGLDEIKGASQSDCVNEINKFIKEYGLTNTVVCSRYADYERLANQLEFSGAIKIQPLSHDQIQTYLKSAGDQLLAVQKVMETDTELREFASTPLNLSIISLAYRGKTESNLEIDGQSNRSQHLFHTYVQSVVLRKHYLPRKFSIDQINQGLSWLASNMTTHSMSLFYVEQIQRGWLPPGRPRLLSKVFYLVTSIIIGTVIPLIATLIPFVSINIIQFLPSYPLKLSLPTILIWLLIPILLGSIIGVINGVWTGVEKVPKINDSIWSTKRALVGFTLGCTSLLLLFVGFVGIVILTEIFGIFEWLAFMLLLLSFFLPFVFLWYYFLRKLLDFKLKDFAQLGLQRILLFTILCPLSCVFYYLPRDNSRVLFLCCSPLFWGMIGLIGFGLAGSGDVEESTYPNQGIWKSLKNGLKMLFISLFCFEVMAFCVIAPGFLLSMFPNWFYGSIALVIIFTPIISLFSLTLGFRNGLNTFILHISVRIFLSKQKIVPMKLIDFLNDGVDNLLLRQVGGGYIFIHRRLLEYFADLYKPSTLSGKDYI